MVSDGADGAPDEGIEKAAQGTGAAAARGGGAAAGERQGFETQTAARVQTRRRHVVNEAMDRQRAGSKAARVGGSESQDGGE